MASIEERTVKNGKSHFRVTVRLKGHPVQNATFSRKTDAKRWGEETEAQIRSNRYFKTSEAERFTLKEVIDKYLESSARIRYTSPNALRTVKTHLMWWANELGHNRLIDVKTSMISQCRDKLLSEPLKDGYGNIRHDTTHSPANVVRYLASLSAMYTTIVNEWEWIESHPVKKVKRPKEPRGRVRFLSEAELKSLLSACQNSSNSYLYSIVVIAVSTGARINEIKTLKWENVDFERNLIRLEDTKNDERRSVPLVHKAKELLQELYKKRRDDTELLFPRPDGTKPVATEIQWNQALSEANIENFRFHDLRHTAASYLAMNGATLAEIADVLGHKTLAMVKRYSHLTEQHTMKIVEKMNKSIF
tara:strand:+ start:24324 stop:25409 length:1086 start_codon:yes stop_codon:yes gene_type:complete